MQFILAAGGGFSLNPQAPTHLLGLRGLPLAWLLSGNQGQLILPHQGCLGPDLHTPGAELPLSKMHLHRPPFLLTIRQWGLWK